MKEYVFIIDMECRRYAQKEEKCNENKSAIIRGEIWG